MCAHAKAFGLTSGPQLCVLIFVLVVSVVDYDVTTNYVFMYDWECDCTTDCYGTLMCVAIH